MEDLLVVILYLRPKDLKIWSLLYLVGILQVLARPLAILLLIQTGTLIDTAIDRSSLYSYPF
jgi:6-phosphogluconate dehydrogenase